jgi:hypothetical protein
LASPNGISGKSVLNINLARPGDLSDKKRKILAIKYLLALPGIITNRAGINHA